MDKQKNVRYPIYIISKGRPDTALTAKFLLREKIPFTIAVEPQEYKDYCKNIPEKFVVALPFSNLGLGSFPARNWCWENSIERGYEKHFLFDDNINYFCRLNNNKIEYKYSALQSLKCLEDFTERYTNIAVSGYNYEMFVTFKTRKAFTINTHVYSGMLVNNNIPYRWRLKYNEDVDLCLQALNDGWCTVLLNAFVIKKVSTTAKMKGGNQTELYDNNNEKKKALKSCSLQKIWPQYVKVVTRFGRPHHQVSWKKYFKHPLLKKKAELIDG